jgi:PAS domain S-box-containing protein
VELREDWHKTSDLGAEQGMGDPFAAAVRWSRMPMVFADPGQPDNPIVYANDAFCKMTGYDIDEVVGRNCRFLQGPGTEAESVRMIGEAIAQRTAIGIDILNYRKDGTPFWNALYVSPVFNEAGKLQYFFSSQFDATERRRHAQAIMDRKAELESEVEYSTRDLKKTLLSLEKALEEKTLLIHEIDHRVKNNLQTISTLIGLQMRGLDDPIAVQALRTLHERVDALGTVHRRLNTSGTIGVFDLADLIGSLVPEIVKGGARGNIDVDLEVPSIKIGSALATPVSLILNELVTNAIRHAWPEQVDGKLSVRAEAQNRHVTLTVSDDGKGMPSTTHGRALSGLKLTEALVRQVRGTLVNRPSRAGTTIEIGLPLS